MATDAGPTKTAPPPARPAEIRAGGAGDGIVAGRSQNSHQSFALVTQGQRGRPPSLPSAAGRGARGEEVGGARER
jgi:hypothetical protein